MCVHVEAGSQPWSETTLHFEGPELTNDLVWLARTLPAFISAVVGLQIKPPRPFFLMWILELNSGPHAYTASALVIELINVSVSPFPRS